MIEQTGLGHLECWFLVDCIRKNNFHLGCYISPGGASVPILVIVCWIPPLGCTKEYLGIQEGHQCCFCICHTCIAMNVYVLTARSFYEVWQIFNIDEGIVHQLIGNKTPTLSITTSSASTMMVYHTRNVLAMQLLCENNFWDSSVLSFIYKYSCNEVWNNMSLGYGLSSHSSVGIHIMRLHDSYLTFTNVWSLPRPSDVYIFFLFCLPE